MSHVWYMKNTTNTQNLASFGIQGIAQKPEESANAPDYTPYRNAIIFPDAPNLTCTGAKAGTNTMSTIAASTVVNTKSTTTSVDKDTEKLSSASQPEAPRLSHPLDESNVFEHTFNTPDDGLRVPQNSPATLPMRLPPLPQNDNDEFTREEAHDCVIDIAKELVALSERVQARNKAPAKNKNLPLHGRQPTPPTTTNPSKLGVEQTVFQPEPSKMGQNRSASTRDGPANVTNAESFGRKENLLLPHLRTPNQQDETIPKAALPHESPLPPHLRIPKAKNDTLPTSKTPISGTASSDSKERFKPSHESKRLMSQNSPYIDALTEEIPLAASISSVTKSTSGTSSIVELDQESHGKAHQTAAMNPSLSPNITSLEHKNGEIIPQTASMLSSNSFKIKKPARSSEKRILKTSLAPSFLDKWGSKGNTSSPKASTSSSKEPKDLENQLIFKDWPRQTARSRPRKSPNSQLFTNISLTHTAAQIRACHLKQLPPSSTTAFICSMVFGGALERVKLHHDPDTAFITATVRFLSGDACKNFYDATANGLPFKFGPVSREMVAWVTLGKEVDVIGGLLAQQIEQGATRCVRAVPVDADLEAIDLKKLAVEKGRQFEGFEDGLTQEDSRFVIWRFCDIADAVAFRGVLARKEEFESCNVSFSEDPCALREAPEF